MRSLLVASSLLLLCCGPSEIGGRDAAGDIVFFLDGTSDGGMAGEDCEARARWVYLVDSDRQLIRFEPDSLSFNIVGHLDCEVGSSFSMAVDRNANAWVLYQSGNVYRVSTADASCSPTGFAPNQSGFEVFGMGFAGDAERFDETLFISGGSSDDIGFARARLGSIDTSTLRVSPLGNELPGWPELTGTGDGQLWGFFPETSPPSASRLDQTSGAPLETFPLNAIPNGDARAWAFAFWGGRYYVFLQQDRDVSTVVYRLDPSTGESERVVSNSGYRIVGAGVSICAPVTLI